MNDGLPSPPTPVSPPSPGPVSSLEGSSSRSVRSGGAAWPSVEALPVEPPTSHEPPLPLRPPEPGSMPPPWDPHGQLTESSPANEGGGSRRNRWYVATAIVAVLSLLLVALLFSYRAGQKASNEAAAAPTTSTTASTVPTTTTPPTSAPSPTPSTPPSSDPGATTTTTAAPAPVCPTSASPSTDEAKVRADVDSISAFVARARGLQFKQAACVQVLDDQGFKDRISADIEKDRAAIQQQGDQMKALGLIPPDVDYVATLKQLKSDRVAGFYDPTSKELVVRGGATLGAEQRVTIAHELTHALQDQWFNLDRREQYKDAKDEVAFGFRNIVEGDAVRIEQQFVGTLPIPDQRQFARDRSLVGNEDDQNGIPPAMRSALEDPYAFGTDLVDAIVSTGGQPELDRVFNDPPKTSEQVMHPEKFLRREPAIEVPVPATEPGAKVLDDAMLGEYTTDQLLRSANDRSTADAAALGWGGDHVVMYTIDSKLCLRTDYAMDTPKDLDELQKAYAEWAKKDEQGRKVEQPTPDRLRVTTCIPQPPPPPPPAGGGNRNV